jgi:hypothetical protein
MKAEAGYARLGVFATAQLAMVVLQRDPVAETGVLEEVVVHDPP